MFGRNSASNILHMIDFGLSQPYIDSDTGEHIPMQTSNIFVGTCRYASISSHKGA